MQITLVGSPVLVCPSQFVYVNQAITQILPTVKKCGTTLF